MHYVPIIDPGISASEPPGTYPPWDEGLHLSVFVRNHTNQPFIGKVSVYHYCVLKDLARPIPSICICIISIHQIISICGM